MGLLALAAGAFAIAAGLWSVGKDHSWLLSLHGLALGAFGVIVVSPLVKGPLSFRPVSLLFTVMAASIGAFALETIERSRRSRGRWFLDAAGAASISFAFSFIGVGFFFRLEPQIFFIWMSSYFVFCAGFMLWLAPRSQHQRLPYGNKISFNLCSSVLIGGPSISVQDDPFTLEARAREFSLPDSFRGSRLRRHRRFGRRSS